MPFLGTPFLSATASKSVLAPGEASEADDWSGPARSSFDVRCICRAPS